MGTYECFSVFKYLLPDRGSELSDPDASNAGVDGIQRTSIYDCDSMRRGQKGDLEQVYTVFYMVLLRGISFEFLIQWDLNLIVNYINSMPRKSLGDRTPYSAALETMGEDV